MSINLTREKLITLSQASRWIGKGRAGRPLHQLTVLRWILDGVRTKTGETVRLEGCRLGSRWLTSIEALQRFSNRLTPNFDDTPSLRTQTQSSRAAERAKKQLEDLGF